MVSFAAEHPEKFNLHIFVDEDDGSQALAQVPEKLIRRISEGSLEKCIRVEEQSPSSWWDNFSRKQAPKAPEEPKRRILFLVCGPEAYVFKYFPVLCSSLICGVIV